MRMNAFRVCGFYSSLALSDRDLMIGFVRNALRYVRVVPHYTSRVTLVLRLLVSVDSASVFTVFFLY